MVVIVSILVCLIFLGLGVALGWLWCYHNDLRKMENAHKHLEDCLLSEVELWKRAAKDGGTWVVSASKDQEVGHGR